MSKFISLVLRHAPEKFGVTLDSQGWATVADLLVAANRAGVPITRAQLDQVIAQNDKQRFAFSDDGQRIRANQGHSMTIDLDLPPVTPPDRLYHGTATRFVASIREQGLLRRSRQHVHLSPDAKTAMIVGQRHGQPVVLTIQAGRMHHNGFTFYHSANGVWLTERVPSEYIVFP